MFSKPRALAVRGLGVGPAVFCARLSARRGGHVSSSRRRSHGDDASVIFAVEDEIGTLIFLTNMVLSCGGRRWHLRVPPWPRRRDASVGREAAAATARRRCSP